MPRTVSAVTEEEEEERIIARCPSESFSTPEANKPVPIRPLKRLKSDEGVEEEEEGGPSTPRGDLSPRRLDMGQAAVLACDAPPNEEDEDDDAGEDRVDATQPIPEPEEGELSPAPLVRCVTTAV